MEKAREEKHAERKQKEKKEEKELQSYSKNNADTKYASVQGKSMEELFEKIMPEKAARRVHGACRASGGNGWCGFWVQVQNGKRDVPMHFVGISLD